MAAVGQADESEPLLVKHCDPAQMEDGAAADAPTGRRRQITNKFLGGIYSLFLAWQLAAMVVYMIRTISCCYVEKQASFQCRNFTAIHHSDHIQLAWLLSQITNTVICLVLFSQFPNFMGYTTIFKKLADLPSFWSLVFLLLLSLLGYAVILNLNVVFPMQNALVAAFVTHCVLLVPLIGLTNYIPISPLKHAYPRYLFLLIKLTVIMFFLQNFALFIVGSIQLAFDVNGLDNTEDTSGDFRTTFGVLRRFTVVVFYYKVGGFFWTKIFLEDRSILGCHH